MADVIKRMLEEDMSCFGSLPFIVFIALLFYFMNKTELILGLLLSLLISMLVVVTVRIFYHRLRPEHKKRGFVKFRSWIEKIDDASFPSMHSMAVSVAAFFLYMFGKNLIYLAVLIALSVFISRNLLKKHYWSDIAVGSAIGIIVSFLVFRFLL